MASTTLVTLNNGYKLPLLGLGTWKSQPGEVKEAVKLALAYGYRHLDCASFYGNETEVGEGIRASGVPRDDIFITSKLWVTKNHPDDVEEACRKTLSDLGLEYLDLYLIHWPISFERGSNPCPMDADGNVRYDYSIHPTDTWLAMEKLVHLGLVRSIGVSNFNSEQITDILNKGAIKPVTNQVECHPYLAQEKLLKFCEGHGIKITAYSPLGSPDRPWAKVGDVELLKDERLKEIGKRYGKTPAQVVIRWQIQRGVVTIPKSVTPARIEENGNVFDFQLTEDEMKLISSYECNGRLIIPIINGKTLEAHPHYPFHTEF